jgi:hypothetical protein
VFSTVSLLSAGSSRTAIETKFDFSVSLSDEERYILSKFAKPSERSVSSQLVSKLKDPENIIGDPSQIKINKFQNLQISDFDETYIKHALTRIIPE